MNPNAFVFETSYGTAKQLPPPTLPEIAFAGRSNVGKSSLLNCLLRRKSLARVSGTPGKTVTVNFYSDGRTRLADLPGYGYAKRSHGEYRRFAELMEGYFSQERTALAVQLIDLRHPPTADDRTMLEFLRGRPFAVALTKADKLKPMELARRLTESARELEGCGAVAVIPFSSETGRGREELMRLIDEYSGG